jgi:hypothetical protein
MGTDIAGTSQASKVVTLIRAWMRRGQKDVRNAL